MVNHSNMKLGRKAIKYDHRTLKMARYLTPTLPVPPIRLDWTKNITDWGMMNNDKLGCCTIAGAAHAIQVWTLNLGKEMTISDQDVLNYYSKWDGYNPIDPESDQGGIELDVLTRWQNSDLCGHKISAFGSIHPNDFIEVKQAINLFGGVYIGVALPITAQNQDVWDVKNWSFRDGAPGSWGGHCVFVPEYDEQSFTCITWGKKKKMTNAFWMKYVDESYALLSQDWVNTSNMAPMGVSLDQLKIDLAAIKN